VASLALGIGANTAIFSLVDRVLLRNLPVADPHRLVLLDNKIEGSGMASKDNDHSVFSNPMFRELRTHTTDVFSGMIARGRWSVTLGWQGNAERAGVEITSGNYFDVLGVRAALGRTFTDAEDAAPGAHPVAVLSWPYFQKRFGADAKVVGSTVDMNGTPMTVLGVTAREFTGIMPGAPPDLFVPIAMKRAATPTWDGLEQRDIRWLNIFARLAPGVSITGAEARIQPVWKPAAERDLAAGRPRSQRTRDQYINQRLSLLAAPQGINQMADRWQTSLMALMCMVGLVLLIACANVANLMIARAAARKREFAIRVSLGGSVWRITRQLLIESLLISFAAGALGLIVATWTSDALIRTLDAESSGYFAFRLDLRILLFATAASAFTAILFGMAPALESRRLNLSESLKAHALSVAGGSSRLRKWMVAGQVALATVLLIAAALFSRSFYRLITLDPGFRAEQVKSFGVDPTMSGYDTRRTLAFYDDLKRRLESIPGVYAVAAANPGPFTDSGRGANVSIAGYKAREDENMNVGQRAVTPGYFRALGTPILAGREFTEHDGREAPKVVVVNQTFVRKFLPNMNPLGIKMAWGAGDVKYNLEIVGVVADTKHGELKEEIAPAVFFPNAQEEKAGGVTFFVRAGRDVSREIHEAVRGMDSRIPVAQLRALQSAVDDSVRTDRLIAGIATAFGALATLLAAIGVYGVIAYSVLRRTTEIGIRIALGAGRKHVLRIVLAEVVLVGAAGLVCGLGLALAAGRYIRSQLFGIEPHDPATVAAAVAMLAAVALLAAYLPARRASKIDPMRALRFD
jgi:predicted permease